MPLTSYCYVLAHVPSICVHLFEKSSYCYVLAHVPCICVHLFEKFDSLEIGFINILVHGSRVRFMGELTSAEIGQKKLIWKDW